MRHWIASCGMRADATATPRISEAALSSVAALITDNLGLHFPPSRHSDLLRGLAAAARERDFPNGERYAEWLLATAPTATDFKALASHLTVCETYFFREQKTLDALSQHI